MIKKLVLIPLLFLLAFSCKKKESEPSPDPPTAVTAPPDTGYHGLFQVNRSAFASSSFSMVLGPYDVRVLLYAKGKYGEDLYYNGENHGTVTLNNTQLKYENSQRFYFDTTYQISQSAQPNFQHTSAIIGNINYTNQDSFPLVKADYIVQVEDTIDNTKNYVVPLNGITLYTHAICTLDDSIPYHPVTAAKGATGFTFTPAETKNLKSGQQSHIKIILSKQNDQIINGKRFRFEKQLYFQFNVVVK